MAMGKKKFACVADAVQWCAAACRPKERPEPVASGPPINTLPTERKASSSPSALVVSSEPQSPRSTEPWSGLNVATTALLTQCADAIGELAQTWFFQRDPSRLIADTDASRSEAALLLRMAGRGCSVDVTDSNECSVPYQVLKVWAGSVVDSDCGPLLNHRPDYVTRRILAHPPSDGAARREASVRLLAEATPAQTTAAKALLRALSILVGDGSKTQALSLNTAAKVFAPALFLPPTSPSSALISEQILAMSLLCRPESSETQ
jgi:hypothetical protein